MKHALLRCDPPVYDEHLHAYVAPGGGAVLPSVTGILRCVGISDLSHVTEDGLERGREVHKIVERIQRYGDPGDAESRLIPYAVGWMKFVRDTGYEHEYVETPVWHKVYRFAGRFDTYGYLKRPSCYAMLDLKCGVPAWWAGVQLAAYVLAWRAMMKGLPDVVRRFVVSLPGDGSYRLTEYSNPTDGDVFLAALSIRNRMEREGVLKEA